MYDVSPASKVDIRSACSKLVPLKASGVGLGSRYEIRLRCSLEKCVAGINLSAAPPRQFPCSPRPRNICRLFGFPCVGPHTLKIVCAGVKAAPSFENNIYSGVRRYQVLNTIPCNVQCCELAIAILDGIAIIFPSMSSCLKFDTWSNAY